MMMIIIFINITVGDGKYIKILILWWKSWIENNKVSCCTGCLFRIFTLSWAQGSTEIAEASQRLIEEWIETFEGMWEILTQLCPPNPNNLIEKNGTKWKDP